MMKSNLGRLLTAGIDLLRAWWQVDRIRVSPREGQLLRLRPPCLIQVCSQPLEVTRRRVHRTPRGPWVIYHCQGEFGPGELWVSPGGGRSGPRLRWITHRGERTLTEDDIQVWG